MAHYPGILGNVMRRETGFFQQIVENIFDFGHTNLVNGHVLLQNVSRCVDVVAQSIGQILDNCLLAQKRLLVLGVFN